jgi:hypothetical protein
MAEPFFDTLDPTCPDANIRIPPAIDRTGLIQDCEVPPAPGPVFQCPPPTIPDPGVIGTRMVLIRVTDRNEHEEDDKTSYSYNWEAGDLDEDSKFVPNGLTGSGEDGNEAYESRGIIVDPDEEVYLAKTKDGSNKLTFMARDTRYIRLTDGPDDLGLYDWKESKLVQKEIQPPEGEPPPDPPEYELVWEDSSVVCKAADKRGAVELTGFNPIKSDEKYVARFQPDGKWGFLAPRREYYIRLTAVDGDQHYDWEEYAYLEVVPPEGEPPPPKPEFDWQKTGFKGSVEDTHHAYEPTGQVVPADNDTLYIGKQDGKGKMTFLAPQFPFFIKLTGGPGPYDWEQVEEDADGNWAATGKAGTVADDDGARENQDLPAIPGDDKVYVARRDKKGKVRFNTTDANAGFMLLPPTDGEGVPPGSSDSQCGSATCEVIKLSKDGAKSASGVTTEVWNPYPKAAGLNASMAKPLQAKVVNGKLIIDVDPC